MVQKYKTTSRLSLLYTSNYWLWGKISAQSNKGRKVPFIVMVHGLGRAYPFEMGFQMSDVEGLLLKPPGANIKEFLLTILSEVKRPQI
jgi:hypothetical protein